MSRHSLAELNARETILRAARDLVSGSVDVLAGAATIARHVHAIPDWHLNAALLTMYNLWDDAERFAFGERLLDWHESVREQKRREGIAFLESATPEILGAARALLMDPLGPA